MEHRYEFVLKDRAGVSHRYTGTYFGEDGIQLVTDVRLLAIEPLGQLLQGGLPKLLEIVRERGIQGAMDTDAKELFLEVAGSGVEWADVAANIRSSLQAAGGSKLIRRILHYTTRDGQRLSDDRQFGRAYRRNWNEMYVAAFRVAIENDFLGFTFTSTEEPDKSSNGVKEEPTPPGESSKNEQPRGQV